MYLLSFNIFIYIMFQFNAKTNLIQSPLISVFRAGKSCENDLVYKRLYHSISHSSIDIKSLQKLDPWFITGFIDGEGSFSLTIRNIDNNTLKGRILYVFSIGLHPKDEFILRNIQFTLGRGKIYKTSTSSVQLRVESIKDLFILMEHLDNYPLMTKKRFDYIYILKMLFY